MLFTNKIFSPVLSSISFFISILLLPVNIIYIKNSMWSHDGLKEGFIYFYYFETIRSTSTSSILSNSTIVDNSRASILSTIEIAPSIVFSIPTSLITSTIYIVVAVANTHYIVNVYKHKLSNLPSISIYRFAVRIVCSKYKENK